MVTSVFVSLYSPRGGGGGGGGDKFPLCSMLLHILVTPLPYNAVAARGLLGRTDKNIICQFWPPRWPFIFITINFYSEKY